MNKKISLTMRLCKWAIDSGVKIRITKIPNAPPPQKNMTTGAQPAPKDSDHHDR